MAKNENPFQNTRIEKAHARARHILKFSPLVTDAYFHYTPSQIMFAALSMADQELAGRMLERTFGFETSTGGEGGDATMDGAHDEVRGKILRTIESCREMLEAEPPERMDEFWGTVSRTSPSPKLAFRFFAVPVLFFPFYSYRAVLTTPQSPNATR